MDKALVLAVDLGTQSLRSIIMNKSGKILAIARRKYDRPYYSLKPGWAEQNPDVYWKALCETCREIKDKYPDLWLEIVGMSVTTIRDTCVCVDEKGKPLRDAIVWLDQREADVGIENIPLMSRAAFGLVGMTETIKTQRRISKCNWIAHNEPEIWAKTYKFLFISGYINFKLTGEFKDSVASSIGHIPFDTRNRDWMKKGHMQFPIFDVEREKLWELVESGGILGKVTAQAAQETGISMGMPVIATGSDKGCETLGCGVLNPSEVSLSFGTSATVQFSSKEYIEPLPFLPAYPAVANDYFNPEIQIYRGYWMLSWFKKEFAEKECVQAATLNVDAEELLNKLIDGVPLGCDGLLLQPYWSPILTSPEARGSIIGFSDVHTRAHIYRAIIEGLGYALYEGMENISTRMKTKVRKVVVGGGGSKSDSICRITADIFGVPVCRIHTYEACALGCALAVYVAMGEFSTYDKAIESMVHYEKPFMPNDENHDSYMKVYNDVYKKIFGQLKPLYKNLFDIQKKHK